MRILNKIRKKVFRLRPGEANDLDIISNYDDTAYILGCDEEISSSDCEDFLPQSCFSLLASADDPLTPNLDAKLEYSSKLFLETTSRRFFSDEDDAADQLIRLHFSKLLPRNPPPVCVLSSSSSGSSDEGDDVRLLGECRSKQKHDIRREKNRKGNVYSFKKFYQDDSMLQRNSAALNLSSEDDEERESTTSEEEMQKLRMVDDPANLPHKWPLSRNKLSFCSKEDNGIASARGVDVKESSQKSARDAIITFLTPSQTCNDLTDLEGGDSSSSLIESSRLSLEAPSPPPLPKAQTRYDQKGNAFVHIYTEGLSTLYESTEESSCSSIDSDVTRNEEYSAALSRYRGIDKDRRSKSLRLHPVEDFAEDIHIRARWALARRQLVREIGSRKMLPQASPNLFSAMAD